MQVDRGVADPAPNPVEVIATCRAMFVATNAE